MSPKITRLAAAALVAMALPAAAGAADALNPAQHFKLRCAAAFARLADAQAHGDARVRQYPELGERGREYFVRAAAEVMEDTGWSREQVKAALTAEASDLSQKGALDAALPLCLKSLDASGV